MLLALLLVAACDAGGEGVAPTLCDAEAKAVAKDAASSRLMAELRATAPQRSLQPVEAGCFDDNSGDASTSAAFEFADAREFEAVATEVVAALRATTTPGVTVAPGAKTVDPDGEPTASQELGTWQIRGRECSLILSRSGPGPSYGYRFEVWHALE